jgi:hypothetical protein
MKSNLWSREEFYCTIYCTVVYRDARMMPICVFQYHLNP